MPDTDQATTRRALLLAAAGGAAAIAAQAALPAAVLADDPNDVVKNTDNSVSADTGVTSTTPNTTAFHGHAIGTGVGLDGVSETGAGAMGTSTGGPGVRGHSDSAAGVYATSKSVAGAAVETGYTGVYAFTPAAPDEVPYLGSAVWGESDDIGVYGAGGYGVAGDGYYGVQGWSNDSGGIGVLGIAGGTGTTAVYADAGTNTDRLALRVKGKVAFSRSGRTAMSAGQSAKAVTLAGVSSSSLVFAQLLTNRPGRWVRAVTPTTNRFTIYLNTTLNASAYVIWWVLN